MSYCPKCRHEYSDSVERCIECGGPLRPGHAPRVEEWDPEDLIIPVGSFVLALVAIGMLYLRVAAQFGWVTGTLADLVRVGQPPIMTVFYAIAAIACSVVFAGWLVRRILRRN